MDDYVMDLNVKSKICNSTGSSLNLKIFSITSSTPEQQIELMTTVEEYDYNFDDDEPLGHFLFP